MVLKLISGLPKMSFSVFMQVQVMEAWDSTTSTSSKTILLLFLFFFFFSYHIPRLWFVPSYFIVPFPFPFPFSFSFWKELLHVEWWYIEWNRRVLNFAEPHSFFSFIFSSFFLYFKYFYFRSVFFVNVNSMQWKWEFGAEEKKIGSVDCVMASWG